MLFRKKKLREIDNLSKGVINLTNKKEYQNQINLLGLNTVELGYLPFAKEIVKDHLEDMSTNFYDVIQKERHLIDLINKYTTIDKLKRTLEPHILTCLNGVIDDDYIKARERIAVAHARIGLDSKWYMLAFEALQESIINFVIDSDYTKESKQKIITAVLKILMLEMQIIVIKYEDITSEKILQVQHDKDQEIVEATVDKVEGVLTKELTTMFESIELLDKCISTSVEGIDKTKSLITNFNELSEITRKTNDTTSNTITKTIKHIEGINSKIEGLSNSVNDMAHVTNLVSDIANQTNLLALNASIESARAGQHGKGFAVVATEVRTLADETKSAINSIDKTIKEVTASNTVLTREISSLVKEMQSMTEIFNYNKDEYTRLEKQALHSYDTLEELDKNSSSMQRDMDNLKGQYSNIKTNIKDLIHKLKGVE